MDGKSTSAQAPRRLQISESPITGKDSAVADNQLALRKALLNDLSVQERFRHLHGQLSSGATYWEGVSRLEADLDGTWSSAEIDDYAREWPAHATRIAAGRPRVGVGFVAGRAGRGRRRSVVEPVAKSLALRAAGMAASKADERVADECRVTPTTIAGYRRRLRDERVAR